MRNLTAALVLAVSTPTFAKAEDMIPRLDPADMATLDLDDVEWFPDPSLPEGSQIALITGNPGAAEVFMVYVKLPPNTVIAPHTHPHAEIVTVLKGSVGNGHGDTFDKTKGQMMSAGSTFVLPKGHAHYLWNEEEVVALLTATGPWNITYVDPADDPRNN